MSSDTHLSRREALARLAVLGVGVSCLPGCGGSSENAPNVGADAPDIVDASTCKGHATLDADAMELRQSLGYVDATVKPTQYCANCRFYRLPEGGDRCGGCQLFAGPVSPAGYCTSWAQALG